MMYDLVTDRGIIAGELQLTNKLYWEVQFEFFSVENPSDPDIGWWIQSVYLKIGI